MARPERKTVDYFPFYIKDGRTLYVLKKKFGIAGVGFFTQVFRFLADTPDHWFSLSDEFDRMRFFEFCGTEEKQGTEMIDAMVYTGKLDKELWEERRVLASRDFLDSLSDAYSKRSNTCINIEDIRNITEIADEKHEPETGDSRDNQEISEDNGEFPGITGDNRDVTDLNGDNDSFTPSSSLKEKKSKVNKTKENINAALPQIRDLKSFIGFYKKLLKIRGEIRYPLEFESFWKTYPRQEDKKSAFGQWLINLENGAGHDELQSAAENYKAEVCKLKTEIRYMKHPKTFLGPSEPWREYVKARASPENQNNWDDVPDFLDGTKSEITF